MKNFIQSNKSAIVWLCSAHLVCDVYGGFLNPIMPFIASKLGFTMALATELEKSKVDVMVGRLSPGIMITDFLVNSFRDNKMELSDFFKTYESINKLDKYEFDLLLIKLSIPEIIEFTSDTYLDTKRINDLLFYLQKVYTIIKNDSVIEHVSN